MVFFPGEGGRHYGNAPGLDVCGSAGRDLISIDMCVVDCG